MTRMFVQDDQRVKTWNPVIGCQHDCTYCWARELALGRLKHLSRYQDGFKPRLIESELRRRFRDGLVFVCSMGDLFDKWVPDDWIFQVWARIRGQLPVIFLLLTKNPSRYHDFLISMPSNVIVGATIETNRSTAEISKAPPPQARINAMATLPKAWRRMVSIEPILDFDMKDMVNSIRHIAPEFVYVGYDNYRHHLPEPSLEKTQSLIAELKQFTEVREKTMRKTWWEK